MTRRYPLRWRKGALALEYLVTIGLVEPSSRRSVVRSLVELGVPERTAYRWQAEHRRWVNAGRP